MKIIFFGTPDFALPTLAALIASPDCTVAAVVTQPDRAAGRGGNLRQSPVNIAANKHGIPVIAPDRLKATGELFLTQAADLGPFDIGVVIAFGQILPSSVLSLPQQGCLNLHASILPRWRGAAPIQRALLAGDSETGISLMQMTVGLDCGPVYAAEKVAITEDTTFGVLHDTLAELAAKMISRYLEPILNNQAKAVAQDEAYVTHAAKIAVAETKINWQLPAEVILRQINAFNPFPGARTQYGERSLKIFSAHRSPQSQASGRYGEVLNSPPNILEIACGRGTVIAIEELQLQNKRRMSTAEFLRGNSIPQGTILGCKNDN